MLAQLPLLFRHAPRRNCTNPRLTLAALPLTYDKRHILKHDAALCAAGGCLRDFSGPSLEFCRVGRPRHCDDDFCFGCDFGCAPSCHSDLHCYEQRLLAAWSVEPFVLGSLGYSLQAQGWSHEGSAAPMVPRLVHAEYRMGLPCAGTCRHVPSCSVSCFSISNGTSCNSTRQSAPGRSQSICNTP